MRVRNFRNFLRTYFEYAKDNYCPDKFHYWTGVSIVAAAMERKVWTLQKSIRHYPNLFVMLIAVPGDGKTTAGERGVELTRELESAEGRINYIPPKITDAGLTQALQNQKRFLVGAQEHFHSSAYYFAGEASNALREIPGGGDIFPTITEAYDCKDRMEKQTASKGRQTILNPCMNVLACATFDALGTMLTEGGIMGGFASRFLYIVHDDKLIRTPDLEDDEDLTKEYLDIRFRLTQDLQQIYGLTGQFVKTVGYKRAFKEFFPKNDEARYALESEKEQAFLARKHTSIIKLSMILAVSEGNDLTLEERHWHEAKERVESLENKFERVIQVTHNTQTGGGLTEFIIMTVKQHGSISETQLKSMLGRRADADTVRKTIEYMLRDSQILLRVSEEGKSTIRLSMQPQQKLAVVRDPLNVK